MRRTLVLLAVAALTLVAASQVGARSAAGPTNTEDPSISGPAVVGGTLTTTKGVWTQPGNTYKFQWLRCRAEPASDSSPSTCTPIAGATSVDYRVVTEDLGRRIRSRVFASSKGGTTQATSAPTSVVATEGGTPANSTTPSVSGSALVGSTITGTKGTWVGDQPITYSFSWLRCDKEGNSCNPISGAAKTSYKLVQADAGRTLRFRVVARNSRGRGDAFSNQTAVVQDTGGGDNGVITLPDGTKSVDAKDVPRGERLIVDRVTFDPSVLTSATAPILVRIRVTDTRGNVVRNAIVFIRSTPLVTTGGDNSPTATDGWVAYQLVPRPTFELTGLALQFFVKAYRKGDPTLAGISGTRLVQVNTRRG
jgi:hypothetical protein